MPMKIKLVNGNIYDTDMVTDYNITMTVPLSNVNVILGVLEEDNMAKIELLDHEDAVCGEYVNKALDHAEVKVNGETCELVLILHDTILPSTTTLGILSGGSTELTREETVKMRAMIEKASALLDDKDASECPSMSASYKYDGSLLKAGSRINWYGKLKRAAVDLWQTKENDPDHAPDLWEDIQYKDGYRYIAEVPSVTEAFDNGERGWWIDGLLYESTIPANVYTPVTYPNGWKLVEA